MTRPARGRTERPARPVVLIARRELAAKLRTRSFVVGTAVSVVALLAIVLIQTTLLDEDVSTVGLNGQSIVLAKPLTESAAELGVRVRTTEVTNLADGEAMVAGGDLDALVSGAPAALRVLVATELAEPLRTALDGLVQQQVLAAELTAVQELDPEQDLDADEVLATVAAAHVEVRTLHPSDPQRGQRLVVALLLVALLYLALLLYGAAVAQGVVEEKANRIVELLLATVRPGELLVGKIVGIGVAGLVQFAIVSVSGVLLAAAAGVLSIPVGTVGAVAWALVWYLLGYLLYATVFAAIGSLVSRQEDLASVLAPVTAVLVAAFVLGFGVLATAPDGVTSTVLSLLPPFAPILMPGRIALAAVPVWQVLLAAVLTVGTAALLIRLAGRIYHNAVLHTGFRLRLRDALS